jgi:hypothetical protein
VWTKDEMQIKKSMFFQMYLATVFVQSLAARLPLVPELHRSKTGSKLAR